MATPSEKIIGKARVCTLSGDLTERDVDAIVN